VSGKAPPTATKIAVECPHCGFKQLESSFAKSTFCRKCSEHYDIGKPAPKPRDTRPSLFARLGKMLSGHREWEITCFHCSARQVVSNSAKSSSCPQCGVYIDLSDFKIKESINRTIETQGHLHVTAKGDITSAKVLCREAYVEGNVRGHLVCSGEAKIRLKGKLLGTVDAKRLTVEKRSDVEAMRPIKAKTVTIRGKLNGHLQVDGLVRVEKKGWLEGTIIARAIEVEKGGVLLGELTIGSQKLSQPELLPLDPPPDEGENGQTGQTGRGGQNGDGDFDEGPSLKFGVG